MFSVDYPLAPQTKYPDLIEYCIKAYLYILNIVVKILQLKDYELILTGDSAGGNICFGVLNWLLMNKLKPPKGMMVCYPAVNIDMNSFTPSFLYTLHDHLLSFNMVNLCNKCYVDCKTDTINDFMVR